MEILFHKKHDEKVETMNFILQKELLSNSMRKALLQVIMSALIYDHNHTASVL